jgi:hypothetical protein
MCDDVTPKLIDDLRAAIQCAWDKEGARVNPKDDWYRQIGMRRLRVLDRCSVAAINEGLDWWAWRKTEKLVMGWQ